MAILNEIHKSEIATKTIIFIHGLRGDGYKTWTNKNNELWIKWLSDDIKNINILSVEYESKVFTFEKGMGLLRRAHNIYNALIRNETLKNTEIIFVGHSLGGLIIKQIIRKSQDNNTSYDNIFLSQISKVVFLATPHLGSDTAYVIKNNIFLKLIPNSLILDSLVRNDEFLHDLNCWYRKYIWNNNNRISHLTLFETKNIYAFFMPVKQDSAEPGLLNEAIPVDANHFTICKPDSKESEIYTYVKDFIISGSKLVTFSEQWFKKQYRKQIENLGDRYTPEINIELDLSRIFNAIAKNDIHANFIAKKTIFLAEKIFKTDLPDDEKELANKLIENAYKTSKSILCNFNNNITFKILKKLNKKLYDYEKILKNRNDEESRSKLFYVESAILHLNEFFNFLETYEIKAEASQFMILYGVGGAGKSHMIADIIEKRFQRGEMSLLFLGQHFCEHNNPFDELLKTLGLTYSTEDFLSILDEIGKKSEKRVLLFIDALNEGEGEKIWNKYLFGMLEHLQEYKYLSLIVSARTEFLPLLFKNHDSVADKILMVEHRGFSTNTSQAIKTYFNHFGLSYINLPILHHEFSNPLFLILLCKAYKNKSFDFDNISLKNIYDKYLKELSLELSNKYSISNYANIVLETLKVIVIFKHESNRGNSSPLKSIYCIEIY